MSLYTPPWVSFYPTSRDRYSHAPIFSPFGRPCAVHSVPRHAPMAFPVPASPSGIDPDLMAYFDLPSSSPTALASPLEPETISSDFAPGPHLLSDSDSDRGIDGPSMEVVPEKPLVPTSTADWEAKKNIIQDLYMDKNYILNDVIEMMVKDHKFKATARMYKGQFAKWKWTKYNKSGTSSAVKSVKSRVGKKRGSSVSAGSAAGHDHHHRAHHLKTTTAIPEGCCLLSRSRHHQHDGLSQPPNHFIQLHYPNTELLGFETSLSAYKTLITIWSGPQHDAPWRTASSRSSPALSSGHSILQQVRAALDRFTIGDAKTGGEILRRAFLRIEPAICCSGTPSSSSSSSSSPSSSSPSGSDGSLNVEVIWDCCLAVPQLALTLNYPDVLESFTRHVALYTALKLPSAHPLTRITSSLAHLAGRISSSSSSPYPLGSLPGPGPERDAETARAHLSNFILQGWNLWLDLNLLQRGPRDHATIHLRRGYAVLIEDDPPPDPSLPALPPPRYTRTGERVRAGSNILGDFESSLRESLAARGLRRTTARVLELEDLLVRMYLPLFVSGDRARADRATALLGIIVAKNEARFGSRFGFRFDGAGAGSETAAGRAAGWEKQRAQSCGGWKVPMDQWDDEKEGEEEEEEKEKWDGEMVGDYHARYLVFSGRHFMGCIADYTGDREKGRELRLRSLDMDVEGKGETKERDLFWALTAKMVENSLRMDGRAEDADLIRREIVRSGWGEDGGLGQWSAPGEGVLKLEEIEKADDDEMVESEVIEVEDSDENEVGSSV